MSVARHVHCRIVDGGQQTASIFFQWCRTGVDDGGSTWCGSSDGWWSSKRSLGATYVVVLLSGCAVWEEKYFLSTSRGVKEG